MNCMKQFFSGNWIHCFVRTSVGSWRKHGMSMSWFQISPALGSLQYLTLAVGLCTEERLQASQVLPQEHVDWFGCHCCNSDHHTYSLLHIRREAGFTPNRRRNRGWKHDFKLIPAQNFSIWILKVKNYLVGYDLICIPSRILCIWCIVYVASK